MFGSGVSSHGGSNGSFESKWVQRVRELYRNIPAMQDATQGLQDMIEVRRGGLHLWGSSPPAPFTRGLASHNSRHACMGVLGVHAAHAKLHLWAVRCATLRCVRRMPVHAAAVQASIPAMGGAPTTPAPAALSQQYLDALQQQPLAGQSADDVLSEIDSSLAVMEQQVARGRSPEAPGMLALD